MQDNKREYFSNLNKVCSKKKVFSLLKYGLLSRIYNLSKKWIYCVLHLRNAFVLNDNARHPKRLKFCSCNNYPIVPIVLSNFKKMNRWCLYKPGCCIWGRGTPESCPTEVTRQRSNKSLENIFLGLSLRSKFDKMTSSDKTEQFIGNLVSNLKYKPNGILFKSSSTHLWSN